MGEIGKSKLENGRREMSRGGGKRVRRIGLCRANHGLYYRRNVNVVKYFFINH